jgi:hypothetical protein
MISESVVSSSTAMDIENFERTSLNNLLIKSKGAPYEEALRRIINQKLYITDKPENRIGTEQSRIEETHIPERISDRKDVASNNHYQMSNIREGHEKKHDNFNRKTTHSSSSPLPLQSQRSVESSNGRSEGISEQHSYSQSQLDKQSESAFRAGVSSSMQEFQYWLHNNRDNGDNQNELQVYFEPLDEAYWCLFINAHAYMYSYYHHHTSVTAYKSQIVIPPIMYLPPSTIAHLERGEMHCILADVF